MELIEIVVALALIVVIVLSIPDEYFRVHSLRELAEDPDPWIGR